MERRVSCCHRRLVRPHQPDRSQTVEPRRRSRTTGSGRFVGTVRELNDSEVPVVTFGLTRRRSFSPRFLFLFNAKGQQLCSLHRGKSGTLLAFWVCNVWRFSSGPGVGPSCERKLTALCKQSAGSLRLCRRAHRIRLVTSKPTSVGFRLLYYHLLILKLRSWINRQV